MDEFTEFEAQRIRSLNIFQYLQDVVIYSSDEPVLSRLNELQADNQWNKGDVAEEVAELFLETNNTTKNMTKYSLCRERSDLRRCEEFRRDRDNELLAVLLRTAKEGGKLNPLQQVAEKRCGVHPPRCVVGCLFVLLKCSC